MQHGLDLDTVICRDCGFVFTNPIPDKTTYELFYTNAYGDYYGHITPRVTGYLPGGTPEHIKQKLTWISKFEQLAGKRLLEVGPGRGLFLWCAQQSGAEVVGIEPSRVFFETLQTDNIPCVFGSLEQFDSSRLGKFDLVVMFHSLEHFYDPNLAMQQARELLHDNGLLVLEVPNIYKPFRSLDRYFLRYVHLSNFSQHTLNAFLQKHGFERLFIDEGTKEWRIPQNLFAIARKKNFNIQPVLSPENWNDLVHTLVQYQETWRYWGQFRWMFYSLFISSRRLFFRAGRFVKRSLLRR